MDRQQGGLHVMLSPYHREVAEVFGHDLAAVAADAAPAPGSGPAATYGGIAGEQRP